MSIDAISSILDRYGYDSDRLLEGVNLYHRAMELSRAQALAAGTAQGATAATRQAWVRADEVYIRALKIARMAFARNLQAISALKLTGTRQASLVGWLDQARTFYANLLAQDDLVAGMARFGYTRQSLEGDRALIEAVAIQAQAQALAEGDARAATARRNAAFQDLRRRISEQKTVLKAVLGQDSTIFEMLGLSFKKPGRPKKKREPG